MLVNARLVSRFGARRVGAHGVLRYLGIGAVFVLSRPVTDGKPPAVFWRSWRPGGQPVAPGPELRQHRHGPDGAIAGTAAA